MVPEKPRGGERHDRLASLWTKHNVSTTQHYAEIHLRDIVPELLSHHEDSYTSLCSCLHDERAAQAPYHGDGSPHNVGLLRRCALSKGRLVCRVVHRLEAFPGPFSSWWTG